MRTTAHPETSDSISRDRSSHTDLDVQGAAEGLSELRKANENLRAAIVGLTHIDNLESFLVRMLKEALRAAGTTSGAVALIEADAEKEYVHHIVAVERGEIQARAFRTKYGVERVLLEGGMLALASRIDASLHGCEAKPDDDAFSGGLREMMDALSIQSGYSIALRAGGRMIGWLSVCYHESGPIDADRLPMLELVADQMTIAVELGRIAEKAKQLALAEAEARAERARGERLVQANQALHNMIAGLSRTDDLPSFLERALTETLRATGSLNGAVVLLEGQPGSEVANHIVMLARGEVVPSATKRSSGLETLPFDGDFRAHAKNIELSPDGIFSTLADDIFPVQLRSYLKDIGIQWIHTMALRLGGKMIGWVGAGYTDGNPCEPERLALLRMLVDQMTIAVELTRMAEQAKQTAVSQERARAEEIRGNQLANANSALHNIISGLKNAEDLPSFLETVLAESLRAAGTGHGAVVLMESDGQTNVAYQMVVIDRGEVIPADIKKARRIERLPIDETLARYVRQVDEQVNGAYCAMDAWPFPDYYARDLERQGVESINTLPLRVGGRLIGCLGVGYPDRLPRSADHLALLRLLADQMTIAVELTRMAEQAKQAAAAQDEARNAQLRADQLAEANKVMKRSLDLISDETDLNETLSRMLEVMAEQIECCTAALCMRSETTDVFDVKIAFLKGQARQAQVRERPSHLCPSPESQFWKDLVEKRRSVSFEKSCRADKCDSMRQWFKQAGIESVLGVPLLQKGEVIGCFVFRFVDRITFSAEQLEFLQTLAHQATLAVQLERLAVAAQVKSQRSATLAERARIARDLHDTLAQGFTGILMHLQASQRTSNEGDARDHIGHALDAARVALVEARRSVHELRSIESERVDFAVALRSVLKTTFAGSLVATEVTGGCDFSMVPESVENELLRIAQEAATNALKHGRASRFNVSIHQRDNGIELKLQDNGIGFDTKVKQEGFGLVGIHERALRAGARLSLTSQPGAGTCISVLLLDSGHSAN